MIITDLSIAHQQQFQLMIADRIAERAILSTHLKRKGINMKPTLMIIGETVSDVAVQDIVNLMQEHVRGEPGVNGHSILVEEGGLMMVLITGWPNRQYGIANHANRSNPTPLRRSTC